MAQTDRITWRVLARRALLAHWLLTSAFAGAVPAWAADITDDFNRAMIGSNWTAVNGAWSINTNRLYHNTGPSPYHGLIVLNIPLSSNDIDVQASFQVTDLVSGNHRGLIVRYQNATNYYYGQWSRELSKFRIVKVVNGVSTTLGEAAGYWGTHWSYHPIRMVAQGSSLKLYIDGALKVSVNDGTFTSGKAGLYSSSYYSNIDDFTVTYVGAVSDTTAPTVSITTPAAGAALAGTVTLAATAADNVGVTGVQCFLDGAPLGAEDTTSPYSISWDTTTATNGAHSLTAVARDAAGNTKTSSAVAVTVSNAATDSTQPAVSITTPAAGAQVGAQAITLNAAATDNVGVAGVQFKLNGTNVGSEDTTDPFGVTWDPTSVAAGSYNLTAVARDQAGNNATSAAVVVTVDHTAPSLTISDPLDGATIVAPTP